MPESYCTIRGYMAQLQAGFLTLGFAMRASVCMPPAAKPKYLYKYQGG